MARTELQQDLHEAIGKAIADTVKKHFGENNDPLPKSAHEEIATTLGGLGTCYTACTAKCNGNQLCIQNCFISCGGGS